MRKNEIVDLLVGCGLEAYKDRIAPLIFPSYQIHLEPDEDADIPIGASKIGGEPDLPADVEWPKWKHYTMSFVAQINLAELTDAAPLPADGLLSFLYAVEAMYEDEDFYRDPRTCRVIYTPAERLGGLERRSCGELSKDAVFRPNRATFTPTLTVPAAESAYLENMGLGWRGNREDFDKYWDVFLRRYSEHHENGAIVHRLLGHPDQIQGDMQVGCEAKTSGLDFDALRNPDLYQRTVQSAIRWRLLLQIDSEDDKTGIMFGDVGRIYFWIREDDLAKRRFDRVVCEMQCS